MTKRFRKKFALAVFFAINGTVMVYLKLPIEYLAMYIGFATSIMTIFNTADIVEKRNA